MTALNALGILVIDVSCDAGMGFSSARPTTFTDPMSAAGDGVRYYGVDHSPSFLWNSATWENSETLIPFPRPFPDGPAAWKADPTIQQTMTNELLKFEDGTLGIALNLDVREIGVVVLGDYEGIEEGSGSRAPARCGQPPFCSLASG